MRSDLSAPFEEHGAAATTVVAERCAIRCSNRCRPCSPGLSVVVRPLGALRRPRGHRRLCLRAEGGRMSRRWQGLLALAALGLAATVLIVIELANGALDYGESKVADPCEQRETFPGEGFQASLQRIVLDGLDGAAVRAEHDARGARALPRPGARAGCRVGSRDARARRPLRPPRGDRRRGGARQHRRARGPHPAGGGRACARSTG